MTARPQRLLRTSDLLPNESLPSFLVRLAQLNHYDSPTVLTRLCLRDRLGDERATCPRWDITWARIATLTGVAPTRLYASSVHRFAALLNFPDHQAECLTLPGGEVVAGLVLQKRSKQLRPDSAAQFCPDCLRLNSYHRLTWIPLAVSACVQHQRLLLDRCPRCHGPVSIRAVVAACCAHCEADLTRLQGRSLKRDVIGQHAQQLIQSWFMGQEPCDQTLSAALRDHPPAVLYYVMTQLGASLKREATSSRAKGFPTPRQSYALHRITFQVLRDWPTGFHRFLQNPLRRIPSDTHGQAWLDQDVVYSEWLAPKWREPSLQFVHEALEEYLIDHRPELAHRRSPRWYRGQLGRAFRLSFATIQEAALLLRTSVDMVWRLAQLGDLTWAGGLPRRDYYLDPIVRRSTVWAMRRAWPVALSWRDACRWLGLSDDLLADFVRMGVLTVCTGSDRDPHGRFSKQAIADLWSALAACVRTVPIVTPQLLDLKAAARLTNRIGQTEANLVMRVTRDELRAYCQRPTLSAIDRLLFARRDIHAYIAQHSNAVNGTRS